MPELNTRCCRAGGSEQTIAVVTERGEDKLSVSVAVRTLAQSRKPKEDWNL